MANRRTPRKKDFRPALSKALLIILAIFAINGLILILGLTFEDELIKSLSKAFLISLLSFLAIALIVGKAFSLCTFDKASWTIKYYEFSYRYFKAIRRFWIIPFLVLTLYSVIEIFGKFILLDDAHLLVVNRGVFLIVGLCFTAYTLCIAIFPWYSNPFRYIAWWSSIHVGAIWKWVTMGWGWFAVIAFALSILFWRLSHVYEVTVSFILSSLFIFISIVLLVYWIYLSRNDFVVMPFVNKTAEDNLTSIIAVLNSKFIDEYNKLKNNPSKLTDKEPQNFKIRSNTDYNREKCPNFISPDRDITTLLVGTAQAVSDFDIGPIKIPIGSLFSNIINFFHVPRLICNVYKKHDKLYIVATIDRGKLKNHCWDIQESDVKFSEVYKSKTNANDRSYEYIEKSINPQYNEILALITENLANKIYTNMLEDDPVSYEKKALNCYKVGMEAYNKWQKIKNDKKTKNDEKKCIQNISIENINKAIEIDPYQIDYFVVLADVLSEFERYNDSLKICNDFIMKKPDDARIWNLKSINYNKLYKNCHNNNKIFLEVIKTQEIATALSWRALCNLTIKGQTNASSKNIARNCTLNLAEAYKECNYKNSESMFKLAIHLDPTYHNSYLRYGKMLYRQAKLTEAESVLHKSLKYGEIPLILARIGHIHSCLFLSWLVWKLKDFSDPMMVEIYYNLVKDTREKIDSGDVDHNLRKCLVKDLNKMLLNGTDAWSILKDNYDNEIGHEIRLTKENCKLAMDYSSLLSLDTEFKYYLREAWKQIGCKTEADKVNKAPKVLKMINKLDNDLNKEDSSSEALFTLKTMLKEFNDWDWAYSQVAIRLASYYATLYENFGNKSCLDQAKNYFEIATQNPIKDSKLEKHKLTVVNSISKYNYDPKHL